MRTWAIACAVFILLVAVLVRIEFRLTHSTVPPGLQRSECLSSPPQGESGNDRFTRLGGRVKRYPNAKWQGEAYTVADVAQGRDLLKYEKLVLRDPEPRHFWEDRKPIVGQARTFLWEHWRDGKRGYLVLTMTGVDHSGTSHVFVEPDDSGRWRIYSRSLDSRELVDEPTAYAVVWVKTQGWRTPGTPLPAGQTPDPINDEFEFRDVCGERTGQF
jgi:hypothetical protein